MMTGTQNDSLEVVVARIDERTKANTERLDLIRIDMKGIVGSIGELRVDLVRVSHTPLTCPNSIAISKLEARLWKMSLALVVISGGGIAITKLLL